MDNSEIKGKLENHEGRIVMLEKTDIELKGEIKLLIKQLGNLTGWMKWLIGILFLGLLTFAIEIITKGVF